MDWQDRKGSLVQWALRARPAERWRAGMSTAHREKRGGWAIRVHIWRISLCISQHILPQQQPLNQEWIWLYFFISKKSVPLPHCPSTLYARKKDHCNYLNTGPMKKWAGMGTKAYSVTKHLSIKMNVSPLYMYHSIVLRTHEYGHIWKKTQALILNPKDSFKGDTNSCK